MHGIVISKPGTRVRLDDIDPDPPRRVDKAEAQTRFEILDRELFDLQDLMWGARTHSLLVVLQGRDAAGKDGAIKQVMAGLNPRGVSVTSFGVPTEEELQHDFLWRVHRHAPRAGEVGIFNRSHYEDVLVVRVKGLVPRAVWKARYRHIVDFEALLAEHGCIVLKFFLHISRKEQERRLLARERDPKASWKLNVEDWRERERWDETTEAYEDAISRCATPQAPWVVVRADSKWYRNLVVAEQVVAALRPYRKRWIKTLEKKSAAARAAIDAFRAAQKRAKAAPGKAGKGD
jgi:PPK2 family polyphosphate:nucleotide phosphotransferase